METQNGLIHIYCGDGKGKTTAAMGLALRCAGHGETVVIAQFLKDGASGESRLLAKLDNVTLLAANPVGKFSKAMNEAEREESEQAMARTFRAATDFAAREHARMLVLDEVCAAVNTGLLPLEEVISCLDRAAGEVVLTGRDPDPALVGRADYITEMGKLRHPFDLGTAARPGVEY